MGRENQLQNDEKLAAVHRKTRQRYLYTVIVMGLYFSFVLNYTEGGLELINHLAIGRVPGSLVMFAFLVLAFIALEVLFLYRTGREDRR